MCLMWLQMAVFFGIIHVPLKFFLAIGFLILVLLYTYDL